ncbi:aconitate hydratase AcnA [Vibrio sp. S4M6]|uniref:aconitate hydratase AcnA n=1 Tax=Vibrio sinus TaxID=2946865 RepID=UPI00202A08C9|nr:aconitate hydratase AcnA [Vibrio sinus]MCL9780217.1 aconitate hydratase AcnA [Vibrio sinus]
MMELKQQSKFSFRCNDKEYHGYSITKAANALDIDISRLPFSIRILAENVLRNLDASFTTIDDLKTVLGWVEHQHHHKEIPFMPTRIVMHDLAGVVALVDFSAIRSEAIKRDFEPRKVNPLVRTDVVVDHSVQVNHVRTNQSLSQNVEREIQMNQERYSLLKWGAQEFNNFHLIPPGKGIIHQINLEYLAKGICFSTDGDKTIVCPDSLIGTDSHTTMINGAGVFGWGVGGIEGESVMLGQPYVIRLPKVIGVNLTGSITDTVTTTDVALYITNRLRQHGVVNCYVEFFGEGIEQLSVYDRTTIANMAPEYGATMGYFPIDEKTMEYYHQTNRGEYAELTAAYMAQQCLFRDGSTITPQYSDVVKINLCDIESILSGPKRPQDKVRLKDLKRNFTDALTAPAVRQGYGIEKAHRQDQVEGLNHGDIVIAAITSCTNTSNPDLLIGAGILAKKLVERGLRVNQNIKTSFTPGSRVVHDYLSNAGLLPYLERLGFNIVAYGCATCAGNSGDLNHEIEHQIKSQDLIVTAVTSANRNFEGRVHPLVKSHYIMSPLLVVALSVFGKIQFDKETDSLGNDKHDQPVYLEEVWPTRDEIAQIKSEHLHSSLFEKAYQDIFSGFKEWDSLPVKHGQVYSFSKQSTYLKSPDYFDTEVSSDVSQIHNARVLLKLGDSITTDHISPVGAIDEHSAAGQYLLSNHVSKKEFNTYGARRGNHEVMVRGTFANLRLKNLLVPGKEGGYSVYHPTNEIDTVHSTAQRYAKDNTPLIVIAGKEYGTGSCRDWAAKGTALLGIQAIIAESFERIHRSNLVAMGVYPLSFINGDSAQSLGIVGDEHFSFTAIEGNERLIRVTAKSAIHDIQFTAQLCVETKLESQYLSNGGLIQTAFKNIYK